MLAEDLDLYSNIFNNSSIGYAIYDKDFKIYKVNTAFIDLMGIPREELVGSFFDKVLYKEDLERLYNKIQKLNDEFDSKNLQCVVRTYCKDMYLKIISNSFILDGKDLIFSAVIDVTEENRLLNKLEYLSFHDQLTGLYNRRFFEEELHRLNVKRNLPLTIVMADVNKLKLINDNYGHSKGDELLIKVARAIKNGSREDDIVARIGGDEFVILLPNTDSSNAKDIIDRMRDKLKEERILSYDISVSFGYSTKDEMDEDIQKVFMMSEDSMYVEKSRLKAVNSEQ